MKLHFGLVASAIRQRVVISMRLLRRRSDNKIELITFTRNDITPCAILSHTGTGEDVIYHDLIADTSKTKAGYDKIRCCVARAAQDGLL